jgi:magnesium transporter
LPVFDFYDDKINKLEDEMFNNSYKNYLSVLLQARRDLNNLRRILAPQREALHFLTRNSSRFIKAKHMVYFRDVYDHIFRVVALTESYHDTLSSVMQAYFSYQSNKLNEIMKRMTVLATLTMPTVMIASIYGMNFQHMPELNHPLGYFGSLALMAFVSIGMLVWMKLKKWI